MTEQTRQLLARLLPRYFWLRDAEDGGGVLDALIAGLAAGYEELRGDVDVLYDQFFIATADPRYIPLIGAGIGLDGLAPVGGPGIGDRALVGRTIWLRRRKGMLATAARGVTAASSWPCYIREGRAAVCATAAVAESGPQPPGFTAISGRTPGAAMDSPWSTAGRSACVSGRPMFAGRPSPGSGVAGFPAPATVAVDVWRLVSFKVTGQTASRAHDAPGRVAGRAFRFDPLGRDKQLFAVPELPSDRELPPAPNELPLPLTHELLPQALRAGALEVDGCATLVAGDLREWHHPPGGHHADAVVDPRLGRALLARAHDGPLAVTYAYGFSGELGGGPYGTADDYAAPAAGMSVVQVAAGGGGGGVATIEAALAVAGSAGASIVIEDSATYTGPHGGWQIVVPEGVAVRIASAPGAAPVLAGDMHASVANEGRLELSGLWLDGSVRVEGTGELAIEQCTLVPVPGRDSLRAGAGVAISLSFSIAGGVKGSDATLASCIVDGSIACTKSLDVEQTTVLGSAGAPTLDAGDCLVTGALSGERGLVRTSYTGEGLGSLQSSGSTGPQHGAVQFVSTRFGDPAYCQLSLSCPSTISAGAALSTEMGAFNWLGQPERLSRVSLILQELLPAGIGACVNYVN
jgi:hypothetical protein